MARPLSFLSRPANGGNQAMEKYRLLIRWLTLAVLAAIVLMEPFMAVSVGMILGLLFFNFDNRPQVRRAAVGIFALLALVFARWFLLQGIFTLIATVCFVWLLRRQVLGSITSMALVGCLISTALITLLLLGFGPELWYGVEDEARSIMQRAISENQGLVPENLEKIQVVNRLGLYMLPAQFILMLIAELFVAVLVFRRFGSYEPRLYLGCTKFRHYRFEDNWVWLVVASLILWLLFPDGWADRVAANALFVMGALYFLRGLAVVFHFITQLGGGLPLKLLVVVICFSPLFLIHLFFGLIDTWIDFRKNATIVRR